MALSLGGVLLAGLVPVWLGTGTAAFVTIMATRQAQLVAEGVASGEALLEGARIAFMGAAALWTVGVIATLWLRKPADVVPDEREHVVQAPATPAAATGPSA